jgi:broad specificity phosphatase PhoE
MNRVKWQIPPSMLKHLACVPPDRAVVVLLRHSVRDHLPPGDAGYWLPITEVGRRLSVELGGYLRGRLRTLRASPLVRCIQTAELLAEGAGAELTVVPDHYLGNPGVFVIDGQRAWENWETLGHEGVMRHLVTETDALPGMARPDKAAHFLVSHMLAVAAYQPGLHMFVTHDSLVTATAARLLRQPLSVDDWPWYLEGVFFWEDGDDLVVTYRDRETRRTVPTSSPQAPRTSSQDLLTDR